MISREGIRYTPEKKKGISGSTLKLIAIFTMLLDHTGATVYDRMRGTEGMSMLRIIGRIAFPIFCFLLVEGFQYTKSKWKYATRLAIFAVLSEVPFDLALTGKIWEWNHQNVFWTLLIGFLVIFFFQTVKENWDSKKWLVIFAGAGIVMAGRELAMFFGSLCEGITFTQFVLFHKQGYSISDYLWQHEIPVRSICYLLMLILYLLVYKIKTFRTANILFTQLFFLAGGMYLAHVGMVDYAEYGVLAIAVFYALRKSRIKAAIAGCTVVCLAGFIYEVPALFALVPITFYNGQRGLRLKYVFYAFYPVHLLILYLICFYMNLY